MQLVQNYSESCHEHVLSLRPSDQRKLAMIEAASLQGASLTDWVEEQVAAVFPEFPPVNVGRKNSVNDVEELGNANAVFESLSSQDWSFTNDDTRYLTHDLHPYPAKFIPQIPAHLISRLSVPGDTVFDPFGGSATTAVEAVRLGRRAVLIGRQPLFLP